MSDRPAHTSYDDHQRAAVLTQCVTCRHWFYMTHPAPVCPVCRALTAAETARRTP